MFKPMDKFGRLIELNDKVIVLRNKEMVLALVVSVRDKLWIEWPQHLLVNDRQRTRWVVRPESVIVVERKMGGELEWKI